MNDNTVTLDAERTDLIDPCLRIEPVDLGRHGLAIERMIIRHEDLHCTSFPMTESV